MPLTEAECAAVAAMIHAVPLRLLQPFSVPAADRPRVLAHFLSQRDLPPVQAPYEGHRLENEEQREHDSHADDTH